MGKAIVYCGDCGKSLFEEDFARGKAHVLESVPYCAGCRPLPAPPAAPPASLQSTSTRLKALKASPSSTTRIPKPPSTTKVPVPPSSTRRMAAPSPGGGSGILIAAGVLGGLAVLGLVIALSGGGKSPPSPPPPAAGAPSETARTPSPPPPAAAADRDMVEREMRERKEHEEAAKLEGFIAQIRTLIRETSDIRDRRAEIEGMIAAAEKMTGSRRAGTDDLRALLAARIKEADDREKSGPRVEKVREALADARRLRQRRPEIEGLIAEVEKAGGRIEAEGLRTQAAKAFAEAERRGDLLGHWKLDGNAEDSSGLGFHGKARGTKTVPGKIGEALWFDGQDAVVELPAVPELNQIQENGYTVMAWYRPDNLPTGVKEEDNDSWYAIVIKQGMHIGLSFQKNGGIEMGHWAQKDIRAIAVSQKPLRIGEWQHVAGTVDRAGGRTSVYIDGALDATASWAAGAASRPFGNTPWRIGHAAPGWKEWAWPGKGAIDDVRLYGRALTAEEIRKIRESGPER
jgi:hypothetical protein